MIGGAKIFKVGDRVRIKRNLAEIVEQRRRNGERCCETPKMVEMYSGKECVITYISIETCKLSTNIYTWGLYAIEPVDMDAIKYPVIL